MPEDSPDTAPDTPPGPDADASGGSAKPSDGTRITGTIVSHISDQARRTTEAAKARRVVNADGEPGVLDLTPLRELLAELMEELSRLRLRDRVANALRQAADIIDSRAPGG
ncbi:MAG TPA: hypothetical protein VEH31_27030 [Streptosporangiaceae bacterium]|nr:hypothetical protein [Streptosporangiaceae bacterium]